MNAHGLVDKKMDTKEYIYIYIYIYIFIYTHIYIHFRHIDRDI